MTAYRSEAPNPAQDPIADFADVARALAQQQGLEATLQRIVALAVETIPGAQHAGISRVRRRELVDTVAATPRVPELIDQVQYETRQGPCLEAIFGEPVVLVGDLSTTERWPQFASRAAGLGVRSMMALRLFVEDDVAGALNTYSSEPDAFGDESVRIGQVFAAHAALAWDHEREVSGLQSALEGRTLIGQAQGLLMAVHGVDAEQAFDLLREASQRRNVKLRDVAQQVIDARGLPAVP